MNFFLNTLFSWQNVLFFSFPTGTNAFPTGKKPVLARTLRSNILNDLQVPSSAVKCHRSSMILSFAEICLTLKKILISPSTMASGLKIPVDHGCAKNGRTC